MNERENPETIVLADVGTRCSTPGGITGLYVGPAPVRGYHHVYEERSPYGRGPKNHVISIKGDDLVFRGPDGSWRKSDGVRLPCDDLDSATRFVEWLRARKTARCHR